MHQNLLRARLELGLTQEGLAASVGVDVRTYRRYESGEVNDGGFSIRQPARRKLLARLCSELGLDLGDLVAEGSEQKGLFRPEATTALQRAPHFVGREALLEELGPWASGGPGPGVVALVGVGGAGKSAVAERLLSSLGAGERAAGVLVWSFYDDERTEVFLEQAAAYFTREPAGVAEALGKLTRALDGGQPHLLVLDGLELVQSDGRGGRAHGELIDPLLRRLLVGLSRGLGRARALVTSRFALSDLAPWEGQGARTIRLDPLSPAEAERLLRSWGVQGDAAALQGVIDAAGGHALSLSVAGSYAGGFLGGDARFLEMNDLSEAAHDDPLARRLSRVLGAYAGAMAAVERDLMARLSVLPSGADEAALLSLASAPRVAGALAGLGQIELRRALARLERLGLVFRSREAKWSSHPFVRDHFRAMLGVPPAEVRGALAPQGTLQGQPRQGADPGQLDSIEEVIEQLLEAGQPEEAWLVYGQAMGGFGHLGLELGEMSRGARVLRRFQPAHEAALPPDRRASLLYERGLFAGALGDLAHAVRCYEEHNDLAPRLGHPARVATGLRTLAYTLRLQGRPAEARAAVERSCQVARQHGLDEHTTRGVALRAAIDHDLGDIEAARRGFASLNEAGHTGVARRGLWEAELLLATGQIEAARALTEANVERCERLRWAGHAAQGRVLLGLAALPGDPARAERMLEAARPWAVRSGEVEMIARIHELGARVALARGATFEAARELASGEALVVACGLGWFRQRFLGVAAGVRGT